MIESRKSWKTLGVIALIPGWSFAAVTIFQTFLPGIVFATPGMPVNGTLIAVSLRWLFSGISWFFIRASSTAVSSSK